MTLVATFHKVFFPLKSVIELDSLASVVMDDARNPNDVLLIDPAHDQTRILELELEYLLVLAQLGLAKQDGLLAHLLCKAVRHARACKGFHNSCRIGLKLRPDCKHKHALGFCLKENERVYLAVAIAVTARRLEA